MLGTKQVTDKDQTDLLSKQLRAVQWPIDFGIISIQIRDGKPTLIKIERTIKLD